MNSDYTTLNPIWEYPWKNSYDYSKVTLNGDTSVNLSWNLSDSADVINYDQPTFKIKNIPAAERNIICAMCNTDSKDLSVTHILKMIETMKAKMMYQTRGIAVDHFECKMTPEIKAVIIRAWKKLDMYGKQPPFIPRYDEYMNKLPDKFNVAGGIFVKIVDGKEYGQLYFELDAIRPINLTIVNDLPNITSYLDDDKYYIRSYYGTDISSMYEALESKLKKKE